MTGLKPPKLSDDTWLGATLMAIGALSAVLSIVALIWRDAVVLLAFGMASGWTLSIGLMVINAWQRQRMKQMETDARERLAQQQSDTRRRVKQLETDLRESKETALYWASSAKSVSEASSNAINTVREAANAAPTTPPRRPNKPEET